MLPLVYRPSSHVSKSESASVSPLVGWRAGIILSIFNGQEKWMTKMRQQQLYDTTRYLIWGFFCLRKVTGIGQFSPFRLSSRKTESENANFTWTTVLVTWLPNTGVTDIQVRQVCVKRDKPGGLGLSVKGGAEHNLPILVSRIFKDQAGIIYLSVSLSTCIILTRRRKKMTVSEVTWCLDLKIFKLNLILFYIQYNNACSLCVCVWQRTELVRYMSATQFLRLVRISLQLHVVKTALSLNFRGIVQLSVKLNSTVPPIPPKKTVILPRFPLTEKRVCLYIYIHT